MTLMDQNVMFLLDNIEAVMSLKTVFHLRSMRSRFLWRYSSSQFTHLLHWVVHASEWEGSNQRTSSKTSIRGSLSSSNVRRARFSGLSYMARSIYREILILFPIPPFPAASLKPPSSLFLLIGIPNYQTRTGTLYWPGGWSCTRFSQHHNASNFIFQHWTQLYSLLFSSPIK